MFQLKQMLNDLVEYTFRDDPKLAAYKAFYIEVLDQNYRGKHGDYRPSTRHIRIMNTYRDENQLIITSVHELAHHINHMQGNTDAHGKGFYANYEKLLHGTLDMGLVKKEEWLTVHEECHDSQGENKVQRMIEAYTPKNAGYKADKTKITVYGGYDARDKLKSEGFQYNKIAKGWEIELKKTDLDAKTALLASLNLKYTVSEASKYIVKDQDVVKKMKEERERRKRTFYMVVVNGYDIRNQLKENGYVFNPSDNTWRRGYTAKDEGLKEQLLALCKDNHAEISKTDTVRNYTFVVLKKPQKTGYR